MGYIGNNSTVQNFTPAVDYFNGNGSTTSFTLSRSVGSVFDVQAFIENVPQNPSTAFTVAGNVITFTSAPPSGTNNIYVRYTSPVTQLVKPAPGTVLPSDISDQLNSSTGYFDLPTGTTAQRPVSPVNGQARYNTTLAQFEFYQNGAWTQYSISYSVDYLIVAGGAGGSNYGGSGAGGLLSASIAVLGFIAYPITIGAGGAGGTTGINGSNSSAFSQTAIGGGRGGVSGGDANGASGGSGGGASWGGNGTGGAGTAGQGFAGGTGGNGDPVYSSNGGGGAGAAGSAGSSVTGGAGGVGIDWQSLGTFYAGGGGGAHFGGSGGASAGGNGGGGNGGRNGVGMTAGTANRGGGGGGYGESSNSGAAGGSGIVIVRYLGSQRGTGGTVTSAGGYTYHTFTSSGTYTA